MPQYAVFAGLVGLDSDNHVVARVDLHIDVDGLQRKAVHPVER
jgi:hypothetical protein